MNTIITAELLEKVASKLSQYINTKDWRKFRMAEFYNKVALKVTKGETPSQASILIGCLHHILVYEHECQLNEQDEADPDWFVNRNYAGEILSYKYCDDVILQLSLLVELSPESTVQYYYAVFKFPEKSDSLYHIERFLPTTIPSFLCSEIVKDKSMLTDIISTVAKVADNFLLKVHDGVTFKSKEFSPRGIAPVLKVPQEQKNTRKRGKTIRPSQFQFKSVDKPSECVYQVLKSIKDRSADEITASSRLLATIIMMLKNLFNCQIYVGTSGGLTVVGDEKWPVEPNYNGSTVQLWVPEKMSVPKVENKEKNPKGKEETEGHEVFFLALLKDNNDYFVSLRYVCNGNKWCVKKIVSDLVPSYDTEEKRKDLRKLYNLHLWTAATRTKFLYPTMHGSLRSGAISFCPTSSKNTSGADPSTSNTPDGGTQQT